MEDSPARRVHRLGGARPVARTIGAPLEEPSNESSSEPLNPRTERAPYRGLSSEHVDIQMHFLDSMHHATHWLKEHELQRSKKPLGSRLCSIKSGHFLPLLEQWSNTRRTSAISCTLLGDSHLDNIPEENAVGQSNNPQHNLHAFQLERFWQAIDSCCEPVAPPDLFFVGVESEEQIPACDCAKLCALVRYPYQDNEICHVWVCSVRGCMFSEFFIITDSFGHILDPNANPEMAHVIQLFNHGESWSNALGWKNRISESADSPDSPGGLREVTAFGYLTIEEFWETLKQSNFQELDQATSQFVYQQIEPPLCSCGIVCQLVFCQDSGGIFGLCEKQACFFVCSVLEQSVLMQMDIGQLVRFGESELDRYTTFTHAMRWFGKTFTYKFMTGLQLRDVDASFLRGSYPMREHKYERLSNWWSYCFGGSHQTGETQNDQKPNVDAADDAKAEIAPLSKSELPEYDYFLSYRGGSGARWIWLTLCGHLHSLPALIFMFGFCPLFVIVLHFSVTDPCKNGSWFFVACHRENDQWYYLVFGIWASLVVCIIILFWYPLFSWIHIPYLAPRKKMFLDKYCIHQSNCEMTSGGIIRLALFLRHSKELVCLFDDMYCTRLWCVWELATYLKLRKNPKVTFICMSQLVCGVIMVLVYMIQTSIVTAVQEASPARCTFTGPYSGQTDCFVLSFIYWCYNTPIFTVLPDISCFLDNMQSLEHYVSISVVFISSVALASVGFILGQKHFRNQDRLREAIASYDIRQAQCSLPQDKEILLRFVNDIFYPSGGGSPAAASPEHQPTLQAVPSESIAAVEFNAEEGLDRFNRAVRDTVPRHGVSIEGIRKFKILTYAVAVLVPLHFYWSDESNDPLYMFDRWAFNYDVIPPLSDPDNPMYALVSGESGHGITAEQFYANVLPFPMFGWTHGTANSFRYTFSFVWDRFILAPFGAYSFGLMVRFFLYLQDLLTKHTKVQYWLTVVMLLPPFLVLECVCCMRKILCVRKASIIFVGRIYPKCLNNIYLIMLIYNFVHLVTFLIRRFSAANHQHDCRSYLPRMHSR